MGCVDVRVLIVEDEPLIAADLEMIIESMGHEVAGVADTRETAFALMAAEPVDGAFVDVKLRDGFTGVEIADRLSGVLNVPVFFLTGNAELIPGGAGAVAILQKPFAESHIRDALSALMQQLCADPGPRRRGGR